MGLSRWLEYAGRLSIGYWAERYLSECLEIYNDFEKKAAMHAEEGRADKALWEANLAGADIRNAEKGYKAAGFLPYALHVPIPPLLLWRPFAGIAYTFAICAFEIFDLERRKANFIGQHREISESLDFSNPYPFSALMEKRVQEMLKNNHRYLEKRLFSEKEDTSGT